MGKKNVFSLSSGKLLRMIYDNFKLLFTISLIAAVLSGVVSFFIKERFKSSAIVYPASYDDNKPYYDMKDRKAWFGQLFEIDHYIQVVSSEEIKDYIVDKYNLTVHYDLKPDDRYLQTKLRKAYFNNVQIKRTRFQSVEIEVRDEDPEFAANIANDIVAMSDTIMNRILRERASKLVEMYQKQYDNYMSIMNSFADSLNRIGEKYGVSSIEYQSKEYTQGYTQAILSGNNTAAKHFEKKLKELGRFSGTYNKEYYLIMNNTVYFGELIRNLINSKSEVESIIPYQYKFIVSNAKVSDKKDSPKRMLIVVFSALSALFLTIVLLIMQKYFGVLLKDNEKLV